MKKSPQSEKTGKLGFFDSGLGGLAIMKAVEDVLPMYEYLYYGDTLHLPYGDKKEEEVFEYTRTGVEKLFSEGALLVILACNTASAETLRRLQDTFLIQKYPEKKILGVIIPTVEEIIERGSKRPLLIATRRTIDSGKYQKELTKVAIAPPELCALATPELVPLIEAGDVFEAFQRVSPILREHNDSGGDAVVLGCTHYTVLAPYIRESFKEELAVISQDEIIPRKLALYLAVHTEIKEQLAEHAGALIKETIFRTSD